jgi:hypothetical protein
MPRPQNIAEIARRAIEGSQGFDAACRELLDEWQSMDGSRRLGALAQEPASVGRIEDAYLAALAEHLALSARLPAPAWTDAPQRFLSEPFFSGGLESLKAILLAESPLAFRRRLIFISVDGLSRPRRQFVEETILGA